ncbi:MAG: glutamate 5-kinase [Bacteroidota bacterium]
MKQRRKIVIKIGTNALSEEDGSLDISTMSNLVDQITYLKREKYFDVILITSGSVSSGKSLYSGLTIGDEVLERQVFSAIGQVKLMNTYYKLFYENGFYCAQVLATKEDFRDNDHSQNMSNCINALLDEKVIPIVNENDVIAIKELMFTDNDELAGLIASMLRVDYLFLLTSVDGVYDGNPYNPNSKLIKTINVHDEELDEYIYPIKSSFGRGGMGTKIQIAKQLSEQGVDAFIVNGKTRNVILSSLYGENAGTHFSAKSFNKTESNL